MTKREQAKERRRARLREERAQHNGKRTRDLKAAPRVDDTALSHRKLLRWKDRYPACSLLDFKVAAASAKSGNGMVKKLRVFGWVLPPLVRLDG